MTCPTCQQAMRRVHRRSAHEIDQCPACRYAVGTLHDIRLSIDVAYTLTPRGIVVDVTRYKLHGAASVSVILATVDTLTREAAALLYADVEVTESAHVLVNEGVQS